MGQEFDGATDLALVHAIYLRDLVRVCILVDAGKSTANLNNKSIEITMAADMGDILLLNMNPQRINEKTNKGETCFAFGFLG